MREMGIFEEIATALTEVRGLRAERALRMIQDAMSGQALTDANAAYIGTVLSSSGVLSGSHVGSQALQ